MAKQQLRITKWDEYQHYPAGARQMIWAKLYSKRLSDYELMGLRASSRELSTCLLCIAVETENEIPNDAQWLAKRSHLSAAQIANGIKELLAIGFVERIVRKHRASSVLAACEQLSREEEEVEIDKPKAVEQGRENGRVLQNDLKLLPGGDAA